MAVEQSISLGSGQNSAVEEITLPDGFYFKGVNVSNVGDKVTLRPKFIHESIVVDDGSTVVDKSTYQKIYEKGKYQGGCAYAVDNIQYWVFCISGLLFQVDFFNNSARVLNPDDRLNQYSNVINVRNMGKYLEAFDYPARPLVVDRSKVYRTTEIEYGTPSAVDGVFNHNRAFITNELNEWLGSDPVGGANPFAPLSFLEATNPQSEFFGAFDLGFANRNTAITYIGYLNTTDSGIGALILSNGQKFFSYAVNQPRSQWTQSVFGGELVSNVGTPGPNTAVNYKRDLYFISTDGYLNTVKISRGAEANLTIRTLSSRFQTWLDTPFKDLLKYSSLKSFSQRMLITCKPYRTTALDTFGRTVEDFAHAGIAVMEFMVKQGQEDEFPTTPGIWTGVNPMAMQEIDGEFYIFSKDPGSINRIYRLSEKASYDQIKGVDKQVTGRIYSKGYAFGNINEDKHLESMEYEISYSGEVEIDFHTAKTREATPVPMVCKWTDSVPVCTNESLSGGEERYLQDLAPGVEYSPENECKKFFRSVMLVMTFTARTLSLFRITLMSTKRVTNNRKTTEKNNGQVIKKDCTYVNDLLIHSVSDRNGFIK